MIFKKILLISILVAFGLLLINVNGFAYEISYRECFISDSDYIISDSFPKLMSPLRVKGDPTASSWARINSKYSQPRDVGSAPHRGIDLQSGYGTDVYPVCKGRIKYILYNNSELALKNSKSSNLGNLCRVIIELDLNNDGIYDHGVYQVIAHLSAVSSTRLFTWIFLSRYKI